MSGYKKKKVYIEQMFTGLIEGVGRVHNVSRSGRDMRLSVVPLFEMSGCRIGESVAVNGVCLTITDTGKGILEMFVSGETVSRTTIGRLKQGDEVNLERALTLSDRLGGHLVSGHVDGVGRILKKEKVDGSWIIRIEIDEALSLYTIEKGSIGVDGISLTINRCEKSFFEVNIIPETAITTTILKKSAGDLVNIEIDLIAKYVEKLINKERIFDRQNSASRINREMLEKYGFGD